MLEGNNVGVFATLTPLRMRNFTWNRFPIKN